MPMSNDEQRAKQAYWEAYYTRIPGTRQVPLPGVQCYNEDGEIVTSPAFLALAAIGRNMRTPMRDLLPREVAPGIVQQWKPITALFNPVQGVSDEP